jgi:hypothetical protein
MQSPNRSKPKKRNFFDVKWMILSGALASTLGFWGIYSRLDNQAAITAAGADASKSPNPSSEASNTLVLDLPPMPTLIPPSLAVSQPLGQPLARPAAVQVALPAAVLQAPTKILLGGVRPGQRNIVPLVRTQSSR